MKKDSIRLEELKNAIKPNTILVSIMTANNEIGTIQPIKEIGDICKERKIFFHTDAVQAIGHIDMDVKEMNIDALSLSGHKIYGPKGVGAFIFKKRYKNSQFNSWWRSRENIEELEQKI